MRTVLTAVLVLVSTTVTADEPHKLASFAFEGNPIGMTIRDFKKANPGGVHWTEECDSANGVECFALAKTKSSSGAFFYFFEEKLFKVHVLYDAECVGKMGGGGNAAKKFLDAFGQPDNVQKSDASQVVLTWKRAGRQAIVIAGTNIVLVVADLATQEQINARKAKTASLGF